MTIVFNNPHGAPVIVQKEDAVLIDTTPEGEVFAATDPDSGKTMMTTVKSEHMMDEPMGMEEEMERQIVDSQMNSMEDAMSNPPKKLFTWKNLRLQTAISGQKAFMGRLGRTLEGGRVGDVFRFGKEQLLRQLPNNVSIRDSPFLLQLTTAEQWYNYLRSLSENPIDVGAELSMTVSPSQRIAVAMFVKEWEQDPGHGTLLRRVAPGGEPNEVIAIGNMVYDIITGRGPNPLGAAGYGDFAYDKMFRLAYDMIQSLPINFYNTYTLFQLEADEGGKIYSEVVSNYTPLELSEVGMVLELRQKLAELGSGYANVVIPDPQLAAEAAALMNKAVTAYNSGDTITVRSVLNYLQEPPFNYMTPAKDAKSIFDAKGQTDVKGVSMKKDKAGKQGLQLYNGLAYIKGIKADVIDAETGQINSKEINQIKDKPFEVVASPFDNTVQGVIKFTSKDNFVFTKGAKLGGGQNRQEKRDAAAELAEALGNPGSQRKVESILVKEGGAAGLKPLMKAFPKGTSQAAAKKAISMMPSVTQHPAGDYILKNPRGKPQGRGKFLELQIHPKTQLDMKLKPTTGSGTGDKRHGAPPKGKDGSQNQWSKGLYNLLNKRIDEMNKKMSKDKSKKQKYPNVTVMVHGGKHKKTGNWAPYRIKLPKSHFVKQRLPDGTEVIGLKKSLADKELVNAFQKFTDEYGMFKVQRKDNEMYFIPHKRGAYYDKVRRQIGGAKGSR